MSVTEPDLPIITANDVNIAVMTYAGSKDFIRMMLPVTVINILHSRTNIASENFRPVTIDKFNYVSFKPKSTHKIIREYHTWMKGAKDAIDKTYLKEMILILTDENDQREHYSFQFKYLLQEIGDPYLASKRTGAELTKGFNELMEQIKTLQKYKKLTGIISGRVQFRYYETITPIEYMPPHFRDVKESVLTNFYDGKPAADVGRIILGFVNTGHHSVKCTAYGTLLSNKSLENSFEARSITDIAETPQSPSVSLSNHSNENLKLTQTMCVCGTTINDPVLKFRKCVKCKLEYHIACHAFFEDDDVPLHFICYGCQEIGDMQRDDVYFTTNKTLQPNLCLLRLLVVYCYFNKASPNAVLKSCEYTRQSWLIEKLIEMSVLSENQLEYISGMEENSNVKKLFNKAVHDSLTLPDTNDKLFDTEEVNKYNDRVLTDIDLNRDRIMSSPVTCSSSEDDTFDSKCICNISISDPNLKRAMCQICKNQFHIACHGYIHEDKLPKNFICNNCMETGDFEKIDTTYLKYEQRKRKILSIMRLIISYCIHARKAPHTILNSLTSDERDLFISQLIRLQILDKNELNYISENDIQKNVDFMSSLFIKTSDKDGDDGTELPNKIPASRKKKTGRKRKHSC